MNDPNSSAFIYSPAVDIQMSARCTVRIHRIFVSLLLTISLPAAAVSVIDGCQVFPPSNIWNVRIDNAPVAANSAALISSIGAAAHVHPGFIGEYGLPYATVASNQVGYPMVFTDDDESDPGPYPIPLDAPVENGADAHVLVLQKGVCQLYELLEAVPKATSWKAYSGAHFDLTSNQLRPEGWVSADAAGLPMLVGLARYDEVAAGKIEHALRFTADVTRAAHIWPARFDASDSMDPSTPPMGTRLRLRADFPETGLSPSGAVLVQALKHYGMILADKGSNLYISGAVDARWSDAIVSDLQTIRGDDFQVIDESRLMIDPNSGEARIFASGFES
jgi:hypothetical protein